MDNTYYASIGTQLLTCLVSSATLINSGMTVAFPSVTMDGMTQDPTFNATQDQISWIASLPQLTMLVGCLVVGPILDVFGRKPGLVSASLPAILGWLAISFLPCVIPIYFGRLLVGLSVGLSSAACSVYVAETTDPKRRGPFTIVKTIAFSVGLTITYSLGLFQFHWRNVAMICLASPIICFILTLLIPESNVWLNSKTKDPAKEGSLWSKLRLYCKRPEVLKPMLIMNILLFLRQMSGTTVILSYAKDIVITAGVKQDPSAVSVALGVTRILAGLLALWLTSRLGRRLPVTLTGTAMSLCMLWVSYWSRQQSLEGVKISLESIHDFVPAVVLICFVFSSTIFSAIPQAMIGEVFVTDVRGVASAVTSMTIFGTSFISIWLYNKLKYSLGDTGIFLFYGTFSVFSTVFAILFLPETHGKTLNEISEMFKGKSKENDEEMEVMHPLNTVTIVDPKR